MFTRMAGNSFLSAVDTVIRLLFQVFLQWEERNEVRVGGEFRSREIALWLEEFKCFHTDSNAPGETMVKIQGRGEFKEQV